MAAKRILLVNDHRETTRLLRTTLETLGSDFIIVDVPSGEEAVLELGRGGIDLLVTSARLPGMSGLDVLKRVARVTPQTRTIVIDETASAAEAEARRLGAAYFTKPLRMDELVTAAQNALGLQTQKKAPAAAAPTAEGQPGISDRLAALRRDLGANAVFLVDQNAQIVVRAGDVARLDTDAVMRELVSAFSASMKLCRLIGGFIPSNVHFFDGDEYDVYAANVGQYFALVIIFDGDRGAGQMGPVMRYGRQCADDLLNSLVLLGVAEGEPARTGPAAAPASAPTAASRGLGVAKPAPAPARPGPAPAPAPAQPLARMAPPPTPGGPVSPKPAAPPPVAPPPPSAPARPLSEAELKALDAALNKVASVDAASFWDAAVEESESGEDRADALSWEQAERLGILPKD